MYLLEPTERPLIEALALGPALLSLARETRTPWLAASLLRGPAIVLGARQRAGRVVDLGACAQSKTPIMRRATTGTSVHLGQHALLWTLTLPHVAALFPDATLRTLLNRNVRGFLKGITRAGAIAHYFGREWISVKHQPAGILGMDVDPQGAVLLELWAGWDTSLALPAALVTKQEQAVDRWLGKSPIGLAEVLPTNMTSTHLAHVMLETVAKRATDSVIQAETPHLELADFHPITNPNDPLPLDGPTPVLARVPIGWLEAARLPSYLWIGGDVLAAQWVLEEVGKTLSLPEKLELAIIEGASLSDVVEIAQYAQDTD